MSDNVKTVDQFLATAKAETGEVWMDNHDWKHLIEMVERLQAELQQARGECVDLKKKLTDEESWHDHYEHLAADAEETSEELRKDLELCRDKLPRSYGRDW